MDKYKAAPTQLQAMECTLIIERFVNTVFPTQHSLAFLVIALFIWGCATYTACKLLIELGSSLRVLVQTSESVVSTAITESFALLREVLHAISQALACIFLSLCNLCQVLKNAIAAIWAQLTKDNITQLVAMGMIIYIFPELIKDWLRTAAGLSE